MAHAAIYDIVIRNALLLDGAGAPGRAGDLAVQNGRIARIEKAGGIAAGHGSHAIEADGLALAPGFIDAHAHDDVAVLDDPPMTCKISQGVTTVVTGNCGVSIAPLAIAGNKVPPPLDLMGEKEYFEFPRFADYRTRLAEAPPAVNVVALVGHGSLRATTMLDPFKPANAAQIEEMRALLASALEEGATGFSTGLYYPINAPSTADEVAALAELLPAHQGVYTTHMRDEADRIVDSLNESFDTARRAGAPIVISHHKCARPENWGRSVETLPIIEAAARRQPVGLDAYPYSASSTVLDPLFIRDNIRVVVATCAAHPEYEGRDLADIAREQGCDRYEAARRLRPAAAIYHSMDEADVRRILAFPMTMIGSDGIPSDGKPHPRLWGTFPRVLGRYSREEKLFPLEEAVRKMTGLTAERFGLSDRGLLREGYAADLVMFDPKRVIDAATFENPKVASIGIERVIVNGTISYTPGAGATGRAGELLRGRRYN